MKKLLSFLSVAALALASCGTVQGTQAPTAAELMRAPVSINLAGRVLSAEAQPQLVGDVLRVDVQVSSETSYLPLEVREVYMVTQGGVWAAQAKWRAVPCGPACVVARGAGNAQGLLRGEAVQVTLRLQDSAGRNFWLRDENARIR